MKVNVHFNPNFSEAEKKLNLCRVLIKNIAGCWLQVLEEFRKSNIWTLAVRSSVWTFTDLQYLLRLRVFVTTFFSPTSPRPVCPSYSIWSAKCAFSQNDPVIYTYNVQIYFSDPVVSEQPSQYLAMDLGYGGMAGATLLVLRSTL